MSGAHASVVAVQNGRVVELGASRKLGRYVVLRDVFGDVFTYAGLGSIAPTYTLPKPPSTPRASPASTLAGAHDPSPRTPARGAVAGHAAASKTPHAPHGRAVTGLGSGAAPALEEGAPAGMGKVRLFAHPGNPDARAAAPRQRASARHESPTPAGCPLTRGSVVAEGTVLGHVRAPAGAKDGHLRFAIRPAGDPARSTPRDPRQLV